MTKEPRMTHRNRAWATVLTVLTLFAVSSRSLARDRLHLEIEPNALQRTLNGKLLPMTIEVRGLGAGEIVQIEVLRDADGTARHAGPIDAWDSRPADANGHVRHELDFESEDWDLPDNVGLWLRVRRKTDETDAELALFGLVRNPCTLWPTLVATFFGGKCDPGLLQALRRHKGPAGLEHVTFEVRRLGMTTSAEDKPEVVTVPATTGATGVTWADNATLLVTRAPKPRDKASSDVDPGLYRVPLDGEPQLLWKPDDELLPAAPLALAGGRIAFIRQPLTGEPLEDKNAEAFLSLWDDGVVELEAVSLPYRIHQLLASADSGRQILALTLGIRSNRPLFLTIDLGDADTPPSFEVRGYHHALYQAALRAPNTGSLAGGVSAVAFEDNSGRWGWDLILVDHTGQWIRDLARRKDKNDLMPAWHPDGTELAFLAEVSRFEGLP